MPKTDDESIFKDIKKGSLSSYYFLYGEEIHFKQKCASLLLQGAQKSMPEFNLLKADGGDIDIGEIGDFCEALPMMSDKRTVIIRGFDITLLSQPQVDGLFDIIKDIPETTMLIIVTADYIKDFKKKGKNEADARWTKFLKHSEKYGVCCEFKYKDEIVLQRALVQKAKAEFKQMDIKTAKAMTERCPSDWSILNSEMDKLIFYIGDRQEITEGDVENCCIRSVSATAFDMAKCMLLKDFDKVYRLIDDLFFQKQNGISIVAALTLTFSDLYRAKVLQLSGGTANQLKTDFSYGKRGFAAENAFRNIRRFSLEDIRICIKELFDADVMLKSSALPDRLILEQALGRIKALTEVEKNA